MEKINSSGAVCLKGNLVEWTNRGELLLSINLDEVAVIGESTTDGGPWRDDWFLEFVTKDGNWKSISCYADGINEMTALFSEKFDCNLNRTRLANSTDWKSIVHYPKELENQRLFHLEPQTENSPKTTFGKLIYRIFVKPFRAHSLKVTLTDKVQAFLKTSS